MFGGGGGFRVVRDILSIAGTGLSGLFFEATGLRTGEAPGLGDRGGGGGAGRLPSFKSEEELDVRIWCAADTPISLSASPLENALCLGDPGERCSLSLFRSTADVETIVFVGVVDAVELSWASFSNLLRSTLTATEGDSSWLSDDIVEDHGQVTGTMGMQSLTVVAAVKRGRINGHAGGAVITMLGKSYLLTKSY